MSPVVLLSVLVTGAIAGMLFAAEGLRLLSCKHTVTYTSFYSDWYIADCGVM